MRRVLLVDDDPGQLEIRPLILRKAGYEVAAASSPAEALERFQEQTPECVLMDLRLPRAEDGLNLLRRLRQLSSAVRILVLAGLPSDIQGKPEEALADGVLAKPVPTGELLKRIGSLGVLLAWLCLGPGAARGQSQYPFRVASRSEVVAELLLRSPGGDWAAPGREAAVARVTVDGNPQQHVMLFQGAQRHCYGVFLGSLAPGGHRLQVERDERFSAPGAGLEVLDVRFREIAPGSPGYQVLAHAPILYARADTVGSFTDVPLLAWCERREIEGQPALEYTVVFSNEDGGTSTRALFARWGRATDIEYVYRVWPAPDGSPRRATLQAKGHKEVEFRGRRQGFHPILIPVTTNNMVDYRGSSAIRYQIPPLMVDLAGASREQVMDEHPFTYLVMGKELEREGRLRPFGRVEGDKVSDPRNYVYLEARVGNRTSRLAVLVRLRGESRWRASHLGHPRYAIEREGWVRTAVELPPGTSADGIAEIGFECLAAEKAPAGECRVEAVSKVFFLDAGYRPGASLWRLAGGPFVIPSGEVHAWSLPSR